MAKSSYRFFYSRPAWVSMPSGPERDKAKREHLEYMVRQWVGGQHDFALYPADVDSDGEITIGGLSLATYGYKRVIEHLDIMRKCERFTPAAENVALAGVDSSDGANV